MAALILMLLTQGLMAATSERADDPATAPPITENTAAASEVEAATGLFGVESKFISGQHFKPVSSTAAQAYGGEGCTSANDTIDYHLTLPHNATVSSVEYLYHVVSGGGGVWTELYSFGDGPSAGTNPGLEGHISAHQNLTTNGYGSVSHTPPAATVINQLNRSYTLRWLPSTANLRLCGVRVWYFPESGPEMTFVPVTPCAVFDTRPGHGGIARKLNDGETINFDTIASDYSAQGGVATSCGIPAGGVFGNRNVSAVALNLVAINGDNNGNLKAWRAGAAEPEGGVVVYVKGQLNSNEFPVQVQQPGLFTGNHGLISVKNQTGPVHVRGVVVGYYVAPRMNQLD